MARRAVAISPLRAGGWAALAATLALPLVALVAVLMRGGGLGGLTPSDWAAARFSLLQAALSAGLSVMLAIPVARALWRQRFPGRDLMVAAMGAPFILPAIVAVMGLLAVFGRAGLFNRVLATLGLPPVDIYGLGGILLAHVFLNLPLAVRMILLGWGAIPPERFRLAAALGLGPRQSARLIEYPMLRATLPGALVAIFLVCLTSFAVVLVLGGGPRATNLELAIYQAFRLEFDLPHAGSLVLLQMALTLASGAMGLALMRATAFARGAGGQIEGWYRTSARARLADLALVALVAAFLALPIAAVVASGLMGLPDMPATIMSAALRTCIVALVAAALALCLSLAIGLLITDLHGPRARAADLAAMLALTLSPIATGTGLFLILHPYVSPADLALPLTALVNAAMAMPFCLRILLPDLRTIRANYDPLAVSLGLSGASWLRLVILPRLRRSLAFAAGLAAALSAGDLGVVSLFADPAHATLPMQIQSLAGAYRISAAAAASLVLLGLSFTLLRVIDRLGAKDADT